MGYVYTGSGRNRKKVLDSSGNPVRSGKVEKEPPAKQLTPEEQEAGRQQWNSLVDAGVIPGGLHVGKDGSIGGNTVISSATDVKEGSATVGTDYTDAIMRIGRAASTAGKLPLTNELEKFTSINHIFSFGCLSNEELNFPDKTYRRNGIQPGHMVLRSGGTPADFKPRTYAEHVYKIDTEYFIDEVEIGTWIAPNPKSRATNFHTITFKVTEPYSMGQLLQTMQICSKNAGHLNYLEAPWLLILETKGYDDSQNLITGPKRIFPLKVVSVQFNVTQDGAIYDFVCSAFNDEAYTDQAQSIPMDVSISGRTVEECLQSGLNSLTSALNTNLLKILSESKNPKIDTDEYMIIFPKEIASSSFSDQFGLVDSSALSGDMAKKEFTDEDIKGAFESADSNNAGVGYVEAGPPGTTTKRSFVENRLGYSIKRSNLSEALKKKFTGIGGEVNDIGAGKFLTADPLSSGNMNFGLSQFAYNKDSNILERKGVTVDTSQRTIQFRAGTKIQKIIEEIVLLSDFGNKITEEGVAAKNGLIRWFRIQSNVYQLDSKDYESINGRSPRIYVYRVIPYDVSKSVFQMPNDPPPGYAELEAQAVKHYNYMYTGLNKDILEFDIQFNNAFYSSISSVNNAANTKDSEKGKATPNAEFASSGESAHPFSTGQKAAHDNNPPASEAPGSVEEKAALKIARQFNEAVMNSDADLITARMTIMGDPYYIADSGVGNFNSEATAYLNLNADGSMNHSNSQVDVLINFKTPLDINAETGPQFSGSAIGVKDFSGLYQVISVNNSFRQNEFTQELELVRRKNYQMKDAEVLIVENQQVLKKKYDAAVADAKENGDKYDIAFALADKDADGRLTVAELRDFETAVGADSEEFKNAKIKAQGKADEAREADAKALQAKQDQQLKDFRNIEASYGAGSLNNNDVDLPGDDGDYGPGPQ